MLLLSVVLSYPLFPEPCTLSPDDAIDISAWEAYNRGNNIDGFVKSQKQDDKVKRFRCKAHKYKGMRRTCVYAAMTEDAAQRSRWTFYEVVNSVGSGII